MRFLLRLLGLSSLSLMVVLLLSSDVRNIVILRVNLIKVTSSSYRHQLSPSSRHNRGGANISSESKDVSNWSLSSTFIADHKPSTELRVWCININPTRPGCPFFVATKDSRLSRYPDVVACPVVPLLRYGGVTLADLCLPYDADIVLWGTVIGAKEDEYRSRSRGNRNATSLILTRSYLYSKILFKLVYLADRSFAL